MVYIARQIESIARGGLQRHGYKPKNNRKRKLFILQGLPGVGPERADRLLARFGSVEAVISASSDELQSIDGIGKNIADKIKWAVSERVSPYSSSPFNPVTNSADAGPRERKTITSNTKQELSL
jgi:ERCC4-type nuclease